MTETPLETAHRVWPGEWVGTDAHVTRGLLVDDRGGYLMFIQAIDHNDHWCVQLGMRGWSVWNAKGDLASVLAAARDHVQTLARAFAASVGVT